MELVSTDSQRFIQYITVEKGLSETTIYSYGKDLAQFAEFLGSRPLREAQKGDISGFFGKLLTGKMDPGSVARKGVTLRQFFRFLILDGMIAKDPTATVPLPKAHNGSVGATMLSLLSLRAIMRS